MSHKKLNQKGFGAVESLLIVIIILLVGFIGYYVWHSQKQTNSIYSSANKVAQPSPQKTTPKKTSQKYLTIKEWGVKLKLDTNNSDTYYAVVPGHDNEIYISSKALDTFGAQHAECSGVNRSVTMSRLKPGDDNAGSPWTDQDLAQAGTKVGNYYYVVNSGQPCSGDDTAAVNDLANQVEAIRVKLPNDKDVVLAT